MCGQNHKYIMKLFSLKMIYDFYFIFLLVY